jgi:hypothetical protein
MNKRIHISSCELTILDENLQINRGHMFEIYLRVKIVIDTNCYAVKHCIGKITIHSNLI